MVGNSLKSDVAPAIIACGSGVYVPHPLNWSFEHVEPPIEKPRFRQITDLGELPDLVRSLVRDGRHSAAMDPSP